MAVDTASRPARVALLAWTGGLGGAEAFTGELALALRGAGASAGVIFVGDSEPLGSRLKSEGIPVTSLGLRRGREVVLHARSLVCAVAAQGDFAILVSSGYLAGTLRAGGYRGRIAAVEHGAILQRRALPRRAAVVRAIDRASGVWACDAEVAVSDFVLAHLRRRRHAPMLVRIYNGVDVARFRPRLVEDRSNGVFVVGCTARLVRSKGVDDLIRACVRPGPLSSVHVRIAGDGPDRLRLEGITRELALERRVQFLGTVQDIPTFWHGCDLAVVPSRESIESFCLAAVEPMACALPVVATRNGALPEIVSDGRTGTIVAPGDSDGLARAIGMYRDDDSLRSRHGNQARVDVEHRFNLAVTASSYLDLRRSLEVERSGRR